VVLALLLFLVGPVMLFQTPVDIFPEIDIPVVGIIWSYNGLVPSEMEKRITPIYERALTTTVGDVEHIESQSLNGVSVIKVFLQPQANVDGAIAEVNAEAQATMKQLPEGITPPLVIRYSASTVPILQLGLNGRGLSEQQLLLLLADDHSDDGDVSAAQGGGATPQSTSWPSPRLVCPAA
jgi:multidrug efflux pump subunit AcrB